ncbi:hypothetical protein GF412_03245 [Candidatus Micrarchaeota archaeon]|nr:hypothetical protein [Candidatus Micrarchaeota archaeon]MBD3417969.1 hypothetical protein [Candidatus Micrarchaeota archaeon]
MLMKGQVTVEYLLLFSVGLVLIAFAVGALVVIRDAEASLTSLEKAEIAVSSLKYAGDEACALGDGNSRVVELGWEVELGCSGDVLKATVGEQGAVASLEHCDVSCYGSGHTFTVSNEYGKVRVEEGG